MTDPTDPDPVGEVERCSGLCCRCIHALGHVGSCECRHEYYCDDCAALRAENERLRADIAVLSPDAATTTLVQRVYKYRRALEQAREEAVRMNRDPVGGRIRVLNIIDAAFKP